MSSYLNMTNLMDWTEGTVLPVPYDPPEANPTTKMVRATDRATHASRSEVP